MKKDWFSFDSSISVELVVYLSEDSIIEYLGNRNWSYTNAKVVEI